jgi:hypothetical protein
VDHSNPAPAREIFSKNPRLASLQNQANPGNPAGLRARQPAKSKKISPGGAKNCCKPGGGM